MKKIIPILFVVIILFTSCRDKNNDTYNAHKWITNMKSYSAIASVTVNSNKGSSNYSVKQYYISPNKLRVETLEPDFLKGKVLVYNGEGWRIHHPLINQVIDVDKLKDDENFIYLGVIQNSILSSEDTKYSYIKKDDVEYIQIKSTIPGGNKYRRSVVLYLTRNEHYPKIMEILDEDGRITVSVQYSEFEYNREFKETLFDLK